MPAVFEHLCLGGCSFVFILLFRPMWAGGFAFGWLLVLLTRLGFSALAQLWPGLLGLWALGKYFSLAGLALGGILFGLSPIGVVLGLSLWPVSLWIWAARHVRHSR
ncbi:MAG: hypothetical protein ACPLRP_05070 [Candidatus Bipolaricaulaceae bacterium]